MEEKTTFKNYLTQCERRDHEEMRSKRLRNESAYLEQRINSDFKKFVAESRIRCECSMKNKYKSLLQKTVSCKRLILPTTTSHNFFYPLPAQSRSPFI